MVRYLVLPFLFFLASAAQAAFTVPGFELVVTSPVETVLQNPDLRTPVEAWSQLIDGAKKSLDFEEMYASGKDGEPLDTIMEKMEAAAKRGVKIRFLLEKALLVATNPATVERLKKIPGLELRILKFGDMSPGGIIHAKFFVVDGGKTAYIGSQNFDWRSLKHIHETGLLVSDRKIAGQAEAIFRHDWQAWALLQKGKKVPVLNKKPVPANENQYAYLVASPNAYNPKGIPDSRRSCRASWAKPRKKSGCSSWTSRP
jgi:phosphatidylserine/phosphatidylglycerophosphate/cardiolipin synthase-like enzyme